MEDKIKVLVVDDSSFMRKVLTDNLTTDPSIEVLDVANNGRQCVDIFKEKQPDVILLDVAMPIMDGITALKHVMIRKPVPIIILSSLTYESRVIFEALRLGAIDFIPKPSGSVSENIEEIRKELIDTIKKTKEVNLAGIRRVKFEKVINREDKVHFNEQLNIKKCVVMAGTLGGPNSFLRIISSLTPSSDYAVVALLDLSSNIINSFIKEVNAYTSFEVVLAEENIPLKGGRIILETYESPYILEENKNAINVIKNKQSIKMKLAPIDDLLISASDIFGKNVIGILLTGDTEQGELGFKITKERGGLTIAQDKKSCFFTTLPDYVVGKGVVDKIYSDQVISTEISKILQEKK